MFKMGKLGKVFDPRELTTDSWMKEFAQSPSVQLRTTTYGIFLLTPGTRPDGQYLPSHIATST